MRRLHDRLEAKRLKAMPVVLPPRGEQLKSRELKPAALHCAEAIGAGHSFLVFLKDAFPINVMHAVKRVPEVCRIFCATANPVEVILAQTEQGRGILGVVDGLSPKGVEDAGGQAWRYEILRQFGYKK